MILQLWLLFPLLGTAQSSLVDYSDEQLLDSLRVALLTESGDTVQIARSYCLPSSDTVVLSGDAHRPDTEFAETIIDELFRRSASLNDSAISEMWCR